MQRIVQLETDAGVVHIDAPVTGGVVRAGEGTLTVYGSGDPETFERVRPLLDHIGTNVFHLGEAGMGCLYKLVNNVIVLSGHMIVQEALVLGAKAGLDMPDLVEKLRLGTARPYMGLVNQFLGKQWENPTSTMMNRRKGHQARPGAGPSATGPDAGRQCRPPDVFDIAGRRPRRSTSLRRPECP